MITKNINKLPKAIVDVEVTIPWADIESKWNETLQKMALEVEIAGFRKGTAPLPMVEGQLGSRLQDEFLKNIMPQMLIEALKGSDIVPIDYPKYQLTSFTKGGNLQFKATITNRPTVTIGSYKTIKVLRPAIKPVTEAEVQKVIDDLQNRWKAKQPTNQATGSISFAGNDEFAKAMGATSLVDLQDKIRKDLESNVNYNNELDYEEAILQEVEKMTTVELPEVLISDELNRMLVSLQRRVADMGLLLEDYLKGQGKTMEQLKKEWMSQAEKNVRMELGLAEIARQENVSITDTELQAEVDKIQDAKVKKQFESQEPRLHLKHALRQTRTLDLLKKLVNG